MSFDFDGSRTRTTGELGREAFWFSLHSCFAVCVLLVVVFGISLTNPDPDATDPKLLGTALGFLVPMVVGFFIARSQGNRTAKYIWVSGLLVFAMVCVWVLDLPTGAGLCEKCADHPLDKLYRTFFDIDHGSGLMAGDGLLVGTWVPLSMIGYAVGARFGLRA